jgi:hypothetical protein
MIAFTGRSLGDLGDAALTLGRPVGDLLVFQHGRILPPSISGNRP